MKKRNFLYAGLSGVIFLQGLLIVGLLWQNPRFEYRLEALNAKLVGDASHTSWGEVASVLLPSALRPPWLREVQCPWAYFRTPIRSKDRDGDLTLWTTSLGELWAPSGEGDLLACLVSEVVKDSIYDQYPVTVKQGDVVIDGGAHIGVFSRFAFRKGADKVVAVDPDPRNAEYLRRNFKKELSEGRFIHVQKALWDREGELELFLGDHSAATSVSDREINSRSVVNATTIDALVQELALQRVDFIKLDIEGAE